ncbi:MAG: hypothetical protein COU27_00960 [Candidatus Levybacteria bacterium CG10_big_fil_rev_8_21_14_0_10_36_7]|nr:MAG: hypothetical protein COU27_00960 [Candidatus Levybacteria bacterium CG10_big_fil_rev_8_21_14_0_10_36_7]
MKKKGSKSSQSFWEKEYKNSGHLALSTNPSEDLEKFTNWLEKEHGRKYLNPIASVLDIGCGNGRNLIYLTKTFGMRGVGYDISGEAISQAISSSRDLPLKYETRSIAGDIILPDNSQTIVLDMMASHFLNEEERKHLISEITRVLKPGGWLFFKTFLLDGDKHAERMLRENPANEEGSYIHPLMRVAEHVFTEEEIEEVLTENFTIYKIVKSRQHRQGKRRSISVYAQKQ